MTRQHRGRTSEQEATLSPRQAEIVELIAAGLLDKQIARELGITRRTVKQHMTDIRERVGPHRSRTAIAVAWLLNDATVEQMDRVWARLDAGAEDAA